MGHEGANRTWYAIPGHHRDKFYTVMKTKAFRNRVVLTKEYVIRKTTAISPVLLKKVGIEVFKVTQRPGDFVMTAPGAHHIGFAHGFTVCEAVNFAREDWIPWGVETNGLYRYLDRINVVALCKLAIEMAEDRIRSKTPSKNNYLLNALKDLSAEQSRLKQKWLRLGSDFFQQHEDTNSGICAKCSASCFPSRIYCACKNDQDLSESMHFCLRHEPHEMEHGCLLDEPHWVTVVNCTDLRFERAITQLEKLG